MTDVPNGSAPDAGNPPPAGDGAKWYAGLNDADARGFAELKGWDSPEKAITSYRELEKFVGAPKDRLVTLPEKADDPAWKDIRARVAPEFAVPDDVAAYALPVPEGFDPSFATEAATWMKEAGIPPAMGKTLSEKWNAWTATQIAEQEKAIEQGVTDAQAALKAEWGARYPETMELARRAESSLKNELGLGEEEMLALQNSAPRAYYKLVAAFGDGLREAPRIDGDTTAGTGVGVMSPEAAKVRLQQLRADPAWAVKAMDRTTREGAEHDRLIAMMVTTR